MLNIVKHNPYRILGVYSNSPKRDVLSNLNKIRAFLKVGKEVSFPLDLPSYLPTLKRDETLVTSAQTSIELPLDQLKHSLFWFMKATSLDDIAFNHLFNGNIEQAKYIWGKKECVSSLLNLMTCAAVEQNSTTFALSADSLFQNHSAELCSAINETVKLSPAQLTDLLAELLKEDGSIDMSVLAKVNGTSDCWQKAFGKSIVKPLIYAISNAINEAKNVKGAAANYAAGIKLMNSTTDILTELKGLLGTSDMQYQMIADKLAQTILQCGINYYNDSDDFDAAYKAMPLQEYALSIAVGQIAKERCQENYDILKKTISNLPPKEILSEVAEITKELNAYCKLPDKISYAITLLKKTKPQFDIIKLRVGTNNSYYLRLSTQVVDNALHNVIEEVNAVQKYYPAKELRQKLEKIAKSLKEAWEATNLMDGFDMDPAFRSSRYTQNRNILKGLCKQFHIETRTNKEIERDNRLAEEALQRAKEAKKKSNYLWFATGVLYLLIAGIIAVLSGHEFWEGLLCVLWPFPPVFMLSGWLITHAAEQLWKLTGNKEPFKCWLG